ncbi:MAG: 3-dehydroquinate synthase [Phycisphaerales bacterium]
MTTPHASDADPHMPRVGRGTLDELGSLVKHAVPRARHVMLAVDANVRSPWGAAASRSLAASGLQVHQHEIAASEPGKSMQAVQSLWKAMLAEGMQRADVLVAMGGGIVGDLAGFAAATYLRGIDWIAVPTTLLAMVDASIGGKTAVNVPLPAGGLGKNMVGAFHAPVRIVADVRTLTTLPARERSAGMAECLKHGMLADPGLVDWIRAHVGSLAALDLPSLETLVCRSAAIKSAIVARDPLEKGERAHLNLGHTFAHAMESVLHDRLNHGEAVGLGLLAAVSASRAAGWWPQADPEPLRQLLAQLGLPTRLPATVDRGALLHAMGFDKKSEGGRLRLILLRGPGQPGVLADPPEDVVAEGWQAIGG